jgi:Carboxypeptidase regulatory-like domain/TonB-dependent Receptor Plug Domain/TonB dependent receptor
MLHTFSISVRSAIIRPSITNWAPRTLPGKAKLILRNAIKESASSAMVNGLPVTIGRSWRSLCIPVILLFLTGVMYGQGTAGAIVGTVQDPSGAAVSRAAVSVTSLDTGATRDTVTAADGTYVVSDLSLGTYQAAVTANGFKGSIRSPITIEIKSRVRADFHLEIGSQTAEVHVSGEASPLLQTDTPETGGLITRTQLDDLPVLDRNFLSLANTLPGTSPSVSGARQAAYNGAALTVSGSSAEANNVIIDGVSNNEEFSGAMSIVPPMDAIQEFRVQTAQYSAEFGRSSGGIVNIALKSGTNTFHGFAYNYLQNDKLDAVPYFDVSKPALHSNQFGGGLGGPIKRDKLFFFGDYQGLRANAPFQSLDIVPTAAESKGDFSASGYTVYDPSTAHPDPANPSSVIRNPFPANQIPAAEINPITSTLFSVWPSPNYSRAGFADNYRSVLGNTRDLNQFDVRVDDNINSANILSGRVSRQTGGVTLQGFLPGHQLDATGVTGGMNASVGYTHIFGPHLFNEAHVGYNYSHYGNEQDNTNNVLSQFNIPNIANVKGAYGYPELAVYNLSVAAFTRPIASIPTFISLIENTYQVVDNLTYERGRHSLKFGGEISTLSNSRYQDNIPGNMYLDFSGQYTSSGVGQTLPSGLADSLLGLSDEYITLYLLDKTRISSHRAALYAQDYWRIMPRLTLSLGLRWEVDTSWHEHNNYMTNFDFSSGTFTLPSSSQSVITSLVGGTLPSTFSYAPKNQVYPKTNWGNVAPRVGLSYALRTNLVARAGFGLFYGVIPGNAFGNGGVTAPISTDVIVQGDNATPVNINSGFPAGGLLGALSSPTLTGYYTPLQAHSPYSEKWSGDLQWSPGRNSILDVGYEGQNSIHNFYLNFYNVATPGPGALAPRQPYPNIGYVLGYIPINSSEFSALEVSFRQNLYHDLTLYSAYTFGKCSAYAYGIDGGELSDPFNANYDWGPCDYNSTSKWTSDVVYNAPTIDRLPRAGRMILSNWQVSGILNLHTGLPYTVTLAPDVLNIGGLDTNRPDVVGNPKPPSGQRSLTNWINGSAFAKPAMYAFGNETKNALTGPGFVNLDFALQRSFPIKESLKCVLRMEAGNIFNHPSFSNPGSTYLGSNFGVITGTQNSPRQFQAVFRLAF